MTDKTKVKYAMTFPSPARQVKLGWLRKQLKRAAREGYGPDATVSLHLDESGGLGRAMPRVHVSEIREDED
jgi:hypothetical protein